MFRSVGSVPRAAIALTALLSITPVVAAQSITDARRVEFTPSADHNAVDSTSGVQLVTNYTLDVYLAGGTTPLQTADLGKPTPETDGMIRVDFVALLSTTLTPGIVYETAVNAVGPGGIAASARSNTFAFSAPCPPTINPANQSFAATGGSGSTTATASVGCAWTAVSNAAWITVTAGSAGTGTGTVSFTVAANTAASSRTGTLTVGGATFGVTQSGVSCAPTISPTSRTLTTAAAATGTVTVTAATGCAWTATSNASWITISAGASGSGNGSVSYSVAANATTSSRSGTLTIGGRAFTVTQAAGSCAFTISPTSQTIPGTGGGGTVTVTTTTGCTWSSTSSASWATITSGATGTGSGSVGFTATSNTTTLTRTATLTIAGKSFVITEPPAIPTAPLNLRVVK